MGEGSGNPVEKRREGLVDGATLKGGLCPAVFILSAEITMIMMRILVVEHFFSFEAVCYT